MAESPDVTGNGETLDQVEKRRNHPLHLHNSNTPGCILTSVQLTRTENYSLWSRSMLINLRAKNKLGFVLGSCRRGDYNGELEEQWEKCNTFVLAWIMNTVSKELLSSIVYAMDASMVWADLKERLDKVDSSRGYQLHRDVCTLTQGNSSVSVYFSKLRLLWDEFDALVPPPTCACDKSRAYIDHLAYLRLFAFLMGLNEAYAHARSQILMMSPLPSVSKAYTILMADESQRMTANSQMGTNTLESIALYAGKSNTFKGFQSKRFCDYCKISGHTREECYKSSKGFQPRKLCDHCKIPGHTREECYKLNGYPPDWKFKKRSGGIQNTRNQDNVNHVSAAKSEIEYIDDLAPVAHMMKAKNNELGGINVSAHPMFTPANTAGFYTCWREMRLVQAQAKQWTIWLIWQVLSPYHMLYL